MTAAVTAVHSPSDNPWSTASPCGSPKDHNARLSLSFLGQKDYGLWNSTPKEDENVPSEQSWGTAASAAPLDLSFLATPTTVELPQNWSDDVSVLNDNPEEDDIEVLYLPTSTYNVLVPLFDELYIDESTNQEEELEGEEDRQDQVES
ncbi:MAG: hypothetical protein SGBAC_002312 [Bacillariaceae sp.]